MPLFDPDLGQKLTSAASTEIDGMITAMHTIVEYIDGDGNQMVAYTTAPEQKVTTTAGLLALANSITEHEFHMYVGEMYSRDEDD